MKRQLLIAGGMMLFGVIACSMPTPIAPPTAQNQIVVVVQDPLKVWALVIAILGALATIAIAIATLANIRIARNSLALMEQREKRLHPDLVLSHVNSYAGRDEERNLRIYAVNVTISNRSDMDNSASDLNLAISFKRDRGRGSNLIFPPIKEVDQSVRDLVHIGSDKVLSLPLRIPAHGVVVGWVLFEVRDELLSGAEVENYEVNLIDANRVSSSFEIIVMREL